jgi:tetratricopeptide (TPR) repeat protein
MRHAMTAGFARGLLGAFAVVLACAGCRVPEKRIKQSRPMTPEWVLRTPLDDGTLQYYVGRSVAVNTLDERRAMNKAMDDAIDQIARSIVVKVEGRSTTKDFENADEARGKMYSPDRLEWETQKTVITDQIVRGLRHMDSYWEIWQIRANQADEISHDFRRYKYWVLVSCPKQVMLECEEVVKKEMADEPEELLKKGDDAFDQGNFEEAFRCYDRAINKYPYARARVTERMAKASLELAEKKSKDGNHDGAMRLLRRAYASNVPADVKTQMRERYLDCYAEESARRLRDMATARGWQNVVVVSFAPEEGAPAPGNNVPVQITHALAREKTLVPSYRTLSSKDAGQLGSGVARLDEARLETAVVRQGDDALISGTVGKEITTFVYDVDKKCSYPVLTAPNLGGVGASGESAVVDPAVSPWEMLVGGDPKFRLDVGTEAPSYRVGDSMTITIRSNRKCFVVIVNSLPNGRVQAFSPMLQGRTDMAQPGAKYSVPNDDGLPFELVVRGPVGKETFRVIASERALALDDVLGDPVPEEEFVEVLGDQLHRLGQTPWTIAACTFDVVK